MNKNAGITITVIFEGMSLNYGESLGNISELKKLTRENKVYTYMSRQALRYEKYKFMIENIGIKETPVTGDEQVVQFSKEATILEYPEIDLFGYMKTSGQGQNAQTRTAVVKITPAVSLEEYKNDIEFATNLNLAKRANTNPNPYQLEQHKSLYTYTVAIDLDRLGKDFDEKGNIIEISVEEKLKRLYSLFDAIKFLSREIKGRRENLSPIFVIGGLYPIKNPFFLNRIKLIRKDFAYTIDPRLIKSTCELTLPNGKKVFDYTLIGILEGFFANEEELKNILPNSSGTIDNFFKNLKERAKKYYEEGIV
ncbi:type I-B CRISPR-associated protein Cas7/Cst2/DevR [Fervidobacterium sp. 2310opik-2]|uniref:type I-B CRISPR-associated protein Cas7/Cst2/DevR n=1 Tax=Fervidobacterium sp. 2310opik-2 TaxID=1755815 RepID=UPI0013DE7B22|nr:type I-B CRISPR-associated protein Cas7/Cst2/DevR [Fervidobacterium sp. 2310opik-2]KAF2960851.1 type I-B CRISPR-associated protein Cas7/Cst2/DevR [Fervidobacterium sp. 2310opik-2]